MDKTTVSNVIGDCTIGDHYKRDRFEVWSRLVSNQPEVKWRCVCRSASTLSEAKAQIEVMETPTPVLDEMIGKGPKQEYKVFHCVGNCVRVA